jgi:hypothetical protein
MSSCDPRYQGSVRIHERFYATESDKVERFATRLRAVENEARDISSAVAQL